MPEFQLKNISKIYNPGLFKKKVRALNDLSFSVERGEVFGLVGPNGAGKSTAIRLMLGLSRPNSGDVLFRGTPLGKAEWRREIGYLPENPYLYDHLTLAELLDFCARVSDMGSQDARRRSDELLEKLEMSAARKRPLRTFSKGMLQRAGICFALLHDPSVVVLDEPMSGLDPIGRKLVFDIVAELKDQGKTVFFCSHILSDVERLCDRIGILAGGRLVREMRHEEFASDEMRSVHILLGPLEESQKRELSGLQGKLSSSRNDCVLSVEPSRLGETIRYLDSEGVQVRGTRSERVTLEELFLQTIEEREA